MSNATDLPKTNPTAEEVLGRLQLIRRTNRKPESMVMSPETWARLVEEFPDNAGLTRQVGEERWLDDVPVRLYEGCLGVGIAYAVV